MEGVRKVQYLSKEKSFQDLQQELNISIPMKDNPLTDSIVVYLTKTSDVEIRETLEDNESVKEVFQDKGYFGAYPGRITDVSDINLCFPL